MRNTMQNIAQARCCCYSYVEAHLYLTGIDLCQVDNSDLVSDVTGTIKHDGVEEIAG